MTIESKEAEIQKYISLCRQADAFKTDKQKATVRNIRQPPFACIEFTFTFGGQPLRIVRFLRDRNR